MAVRMVDKNTIQNIFTCNATFIQINTTDDIEDKIRELLKDKTIEEQIAILKWEIEKLKLRQM